MIWKPLTGGRENPSVAAPSIAAIENPFTLIVSFTWFPFELFACTYVPLKLVFAAFVRFTLVAISGRPFA
jgi:hypothetical protein